MTTVRLDFSSGPQSFYGVLHVTVLSGTPVLHGARLTPGFSGTVRAPLYSLPATFESSSAFSLQLTAPARDCVTPSERPFYFARSPPIGYYDLFAGVYHSNIYRGAVYPQPAEAFVASLLRRPRAVLFVAGGKSAGKSTFARYLANRIVSERGRVAFLDIDPGQPELALPGTVSLALLSDFLLNPPERQCRTAQRVLPVGAVSIPDCCERYFACVQRLLGEVPDDAFVVVNSFGWVHDLGLTMHERLLEMVRPDVAFVMHRPDEAPARVCPRIFAVEVSPAQAPMAIYPKRQRELRIAAYFAECAGEAPRAVPLRRLRVAFLCKRVHPREALTALSGALVALCRDERSFAPAERMVSLLREAPEAECCGFAVVQGFDMEREMAYLMTPVEVEEDFNTMVMGTVQVPADMYAKTSVAAPNYLGIGLLEKIGASTDPLTLKNTPVFD